MIKDLLQQLFLALDVLHNVNVTHRYDAAIYSINFSLCTLLLKTEDVLPLPVMI